MIGYVFLHLVVLQIKKEDYIFLLRWLDGIMVLFSEINWLFYPIIKLALDKDTKIQFDSLLVYKKVFGNAVTTSCPAYNNESARNISVVMTLLAKSGLHVHFIKA